MRMDVLVIGILISVVALLVACYGAIRSLVPRLAAVEQQQTSLGEGLSGLRTKLVEADTTARGLAQTTTEIRSGLSTAHQHLSALQAYAKSRQDLELRTASSIQRLEAVIAGTQTKGMAGENIIETVFSQLPAEWQVRNFHVANKIVEFGLRLPNNLVLPIDCKWPATRMVQELLDSDDSEHRRRLKRDIERAVLAKVREVQKYLDPDLTADFGIAVVPDAVFDLCSQIQVEAYKLNVVLVGYGMFIPYLLLVFHTFLKSAQQIDLERLTSYLNAAQASITDLQDEVEGRFSRAVTMLSNSRDDMGAQLARVNAQLTSLELGAAAPTGMEIARSSAGAGGK